MFEYTPAASGQFFAGHRSRYGPKKMECCGNPSTPVLTMDTPTKKIWECEHCMKEYFWGAEKGGPQ